VALAGKDVQLGLLVTDAILVFGKTVSRTWPFWSMVAEANRGVNIHHTRLGKCIVTRQWDGEGTFSERVVVQVRSYRENNTVRAIRRGTM
jgi:hypothetical protein